MYGFPSNFDASRFLGCVLESISFTVNTIHFQFEDDVSITIESCLSHVLEKDSEFKKIHIPILESQLMQLIGEKIEFSEAKTDGTLILQFSNDQKLMVYDDTPMYESYQMRFGDNEIIV